MTRANRMSGVRDALAKARAAGKHGVFFVSLDLDGPESAARGDADWRMGPGWVLADAMRRRDSGFDPLPHEWWVVVLGDARGRPHYAASLLDAAPMVHAQLAGVVIETGAGVEVFR